MTTDRPPWSRSATSRSTSPSPSGIIFQRQIGAVQGGRRRVVRRPARRDAWDRRRDRLRQEHDRRGCSCACSTRPPARSCSRARTWPSARALDAEAAAPRGADRLPGPVLVAQPAQDGRLDHRRAVRDPRLYTGEGERKQRVQELMDRVGLNPEHYNRYPHEFSGGQRQRIGVARAIALEPKLLIADEPVSALDVSIQAQVLNLLPRLQREMGLTLVFISHDLSVVRHMWRPGRGDVPRQGGRAGLQRCAVPFPRHPYTGALLSAVPVPDPGWRPAPACAARRRCAQPGQSPAGVPVPHPLPEGPGPLPDQEPPLEDQGRGVRSRRATSRSPARRSGGAAAAKAAKKKAQD